VDLYRPDFCSWRGIAPRKRARYGSGWLQANGCITPRDASVRTANSVDVDVYAVPLEVYGEARGCFAIYRDVFEQIQAQRQAKQHAESLARMVDELRLRATEMKLLNEMGDLLQCCCECGGSLPGGRRFGPEDPAHRHERAFFISSSPRGTPWMPRPSGANRGCRNRPSLRRRVGACAEGNRTGASIPVQDSCAST
jgi:hypothetical protein